MADVASASTFYALALRTLQQPGGVGAVAQQLAGAFDAPRTAAAEPYTDLFLGYTTAQGLASRHVTVVVGPHAASFVGALMGRAADDAAADESAPAEQMQDMKIAWRYNQLQRVAPPPVRAKEGTSSADSLSRFLQRV